MENKIEFVHSVIYTARAPDNITQEELDRIVKTSCRNNAKAGITGVLFYKQGQYLQLLEGDQEAVNDLITIIAADPRCSEMVVLEANTAPRIFDQWSMDYADLSQTDVQDFLFDLVRLPWTQEQHSKTPRLIRKLMVRFRHRLVIPMRVAHLRHRKWNVLKAGRRPKSS